MQKLSGKRNRFGQHSGEQYDCTEEVIRIAAQQFADNLSGKRTEADGGLLESEKILDLLFLYLRCAKVRACQGSW